MKIIAAVTTMLLLVASGAIAETTNSLTGSEIQGRALVQQLLQQRPAEDFTNSGVLQIRDSNGKRLKIPIHSQIIITEPNSLNWLHSYQATMTNNEIRLMVVHTPEAGLNKYQLFTDGVQKNITGSETMTSFADSDFWICDLGLEFFHWPQQKVIKKENHRSCGCIVLESTNPNPTTNSYSRVVSWIDSESLGIVEAYAYDAKGKLLKDFYPKDLKKINGQWQVQTLVMENVQTGSKSRLEFDLKK